MRLKAVVLGAIVAWAAACSDTTRTPIVVVVPPNVAPVFQGIASAIAAGGGTIRVSWGAAHDDNTPQGSIQYQVFVAGTSGGQNFASPSASVTGGTATNISGAPGSPIYVVVRAVDGNGVSEQNTVEIRVVPPAGGTHIYVDDSAAGPGTGTFADPFTTIQAGVSAAEALAAGGIVLVSAGSYNEQVRITSAGAGPIHVVGGFPNWASFGGSEPPAGTILASYDPVTNVTLVDGTGISQYTGSTEGLIHVANTGRVTQLSGLRVDEAEAIAIFGIDVDISVTDVTIRNSQVSNVTEIGIRLTTSSAAFDNMAWITGNDVAEVLSGGILFRSRAVEFGGTTAFISVSGNRFVNHQSFTSSSVGVATHTEVAEVAVLDTDSVVVPSGVTTTIRVDDNLIRRFNSDAIALDFEPEATTTAGSLDISASRNRIEFIGSSGDGVDLDDIVFFGDGGTGTFAINNNRMVSIDGEAIEIDFIETQTIAVNTDIDGSTTIMANNNWLSLVDSGLFEVDEWTPPVGGTADITFDGNEAGSIESSATDLDDFFYGAIAGPTDGTGTITFTNGLYHAINGQIPDIDFGNPPGAAGMLTILVKDNTNASPDDHPTIEVDVDTQLGTNAAGTVYNQSVTIVDNYIPSNYTSSTEMIEVDSLVSNGTSSVTISRNLERGDGEGFDIDHEDQSDATGPAPVSTIIALDNDIWSHDGNGMEIDVDLAGGGRTYVDIRNNSVLCDESAFDFTMEASSVASGPNGTGFVTIFNNDVISSDAGDQLNYESFIDPTAGEVVYGFIRNNTIGFGTESSGTQLDIDENDLLVFSRNFVGFGEVDSDDGLELRSGGTNPGLFMVNNNLLVQNPGDAIESFGQGTLPQLINNTIAYNTMGGTGTYFGVNSSSSAGFSQLHVRNSVLFLNGTGDLDTFDLLAATYSLVSSEDPATGFGNISGDPQFQQNGTGLFDFKQNYRVGPSSPTLNAGDPAAEFNDPDGSRNDMGAYGGPGAGELGALLPLKPDTPLVVLGISRPVAAAPVQSPLVDLFAGGILQPFDGTFPVTVVLSAPVDPVTLSAGIGFSVGGAPVAGALTASTDGRIVTFTPSAAVAGGSVVRVDVGSGLTDANGVPLDHPYVNFFGVAPSATPEVEGAGPDSNSTSGTAQAIAGTPAVIGITGSLFDDTDPGDFYSFAGTAGERVQLSLLGERAGTPSASADFALELIDTDGTTIISAANNEMGTVGGTQADPYIDHVLTSTGTFFIRVFPAVAPAVGGPYAYELHGFIR